MHMILSAFYVIGSTIGGAVGFVIGAFALMFLALIGIGLFASTLQVIDEQITHRWQPLSLAFGWTLSVVALPITVFIGLFKGLGTGFTDAFLEPSWKTVLMVPVKPFKTAGQDVYEEFRHSYDKYTRPSESLRVALVSKA